MLAAGTTYKLDYAVSGGLTGTSSTEGSIGAATTFNGNANVMPITQTVVTSYSAPAAQAGTVTVNMTSHQQLDGFDILSYGGTLSTTVMGVATNTTIIINPAARDKRYTLSAGGTYTLAQTLNMTITILGVPTQQTVSTSTLVTYVGQESVTVPAGTYTACKFTDTTDGATSTSWIVKGKGVMAKSVTPSDGGEVTLQLQGTSRLNGAAI